MLYQRLAEGPAAAAPASSQQQQPFLATGPSGEASPTSASAGFGRWDAAPDLERWLTSFYQYFEMKGYRGLVAIHLLHLAAVAFTIVFSFWVFFFVDWEAVLSCRTEETCRSVSLTYAQPFQEMGARRFMVLLFFILFLVYWLFNVVNAYQTLRDAAEMSQYYKERLGIISDDILGTMLWSEVVSRLVQQQKSMPFCVVQDELTALEIANIIMREDNYIIALTNHHAFTSRFPRWIPARLAYTQAVLTCLRTAVFKWAFDSRGRVRQDFINCPVKLAKRLRLMGLMTLLLVIPVSIFVTLVFFMRHAEEFRSHRTSPFRREWTDYAKWTFREFNEFPHQFKERMRSAQIMAEDYAGSTRQPSPVRDSLQRFVKFVAGSILAVLLVIALWDDTPLLFVKIQEKNLLWYLAFFGFLFAVADNSSEDAAPGGRLLPGHRSPSCTGTPLLMHVAMMRLVRCTHYLPASWRPPAPLASLAGGCNGVQRARLCQHFEKIRSEFLSDFFVHRIQALAEELLGVLLAPLLLIVYLPESAPDIVDVIRRSQHTSQNLGDWCVFGCLDPSQSGSEFYSGPAWRLSLGSNSSSAGEPPSSAAGFAEPRLYSNNGKLEKSVLSFILTHRLPWSGSPRLGASAGEDEDFSLSHDLAFGAATAAATGRRPPHGQGGARTFRRAGAGGASGDGPAIPLKDFSAPAKEAMAYRPEAVEEARPADEAAVGAEVWGYPSCASSLLHDLEEFQQRETGTASPQHKLYKLFPEELLRLDRALPVLGGAPLPPAAPLASGSTGPLDGQVGQGSCSSHFFWLEMLYDFYSGRHASHLGDAGGGVTFELLERDPEAAA